MASTVYEAKKVCHNNNLCIVQLPRYHPIPPLLVENGAIDPPPPSCPRVTCFQRISGFCNQLFFTRLGDWSYAQPPLWRVGFFFRGFLPLGLTTEFSILLDELPTRAMSRVNPELNGFRAPTARPRTTRISDEQPSVVNASGGDLTNRGCGETQAFWEHFIETRSSSRIPPRPYLSFWGLSV